MQAKPGKEHLHLGLCFVNVASRIASDGCRVRIGHDPAMEDEDDYDDTKRLWMLW